MDIKELQEMNIHELVEVARGMNIEALSTLRKSELIFKILEGQTEKNGLIYAAECLKEQTIHGHVTLRHSVRSRLAAVAAEYL